MNARVASALLAAVILSAGLSGVPFRAAEPPPGGDDAGTSPQRPLHVSIIRLIASPEEYDGKYVRVMGYVRLEHEGSSVYLHREDFAHALTKNGLWLEGPESGDVSDTYALIEGRFVADDHGHRGLWSGAIRDITRMIPWKVRGEADE